MVPRIAVCLVVALICLPATAAPPKLACTLSDDKSSILVIGSNPSDTSYTCQAWCRVTVTGQRAFEEFDCRFNIGKNAPEKAMCNRDGGDAGHYKAIDSNKWTCVPR